MKTNWTAKRIAVANALRDFETAHRVYMNTSVFTEAGKEAKRIMREAGAAYDAAQADFRKECAQ